MTVVVGVDPSARKIACVAYETITRTHRTVTASLYAKGQTKQDVESLHNALTFMRHFSAEAALMSQHRVAFVESPVFGRGSNVTTLKQGYVGGIIRACLAEAGFQVYDANVGSWRSHLGIRPGKGMSTAILKEQTLQAVVWRWPKIQAQVASDHDLADAAGIAIYGVDQVRKSARNGPPRPPRPRVQRR